MKRSAGAMVMLAALGGCMSMDHGPSPVAVEGQHDGSGHIAVPGVVGPWGQPVPYNPARVAAGSNGVTPVAAMGIDNLHGGVDSGVVQANYVPVQLPSYAGMNGMGACVANAAGGPAGMQTMPPFMRRRTEVRFVSPNGMKISWYVPSSDGRGAFTPSFLTAPARYNFLQGAIYRLKLTNIANRPGLELYPTVEVVPSGPHSDTFLAHSAVPVTFSDEDLDQVASGNFVVKVIYLPDAQYQDLATVGPDELVSSRLEPGVDPIAEAHRRGNILLVIRLGNIDLEVPNTPAMDAPGAAMPVPTSMKRNPVPPGKMAVTAIQPPAKLTVSQGPTTAMGSPYTTTQAQQQMPTAPMPVGSVSTSMGTQAATIHVESRPDAPPANWWTNTPATKN